MLLCYVCVFCSVQYVNVCCVGMFGLCGCGTCCVMYVDLLCCVLFRFVGCRVCCGVRVCVVCYVCLCCCVVFRSVLFGFVMLGCMFVLFGYAM